MPASLANGYLISIMVPLRLLIPSLLQKREFEAWFIQHAQIQFGDLPTFETRISSMLPLKYRVDCSLPIYTGWAWTFAFAGDGTTNC